MRIHRLEREQRIPVALEQVVAFFSDAANLDAITPPWVGFRFVTPLPIVQERGPYALWEHLHQFEPCAGGVLMRDLVRYALPFGPLGALAHPPVRASLAAIFDHRFAVIRERFGDPWPAARVENAEDRG